MFFRILLDILQKMYGRKSILVPTYEWLSVMSHV